MASTSHVDEASSLQARDARFRNLYTHPPDFQQLSLRDADFTAVVKGRQLDFCDPKAVMQLTKTLLKLDFGIDCQLPHDRLCPPVVNRHNYILWLKDLMDSSSYQPPGQSLTGLDIGTGASCIYPLLGCVQRPWSFIATDIDHESLQWARSNIERNGLSNRIRLVAREPNQALIPLDELGIGSIDWTMTNPPFYKSQDDMLQSAAEKSRPPLTACTGSLGEMVTQGGELGFVLRILQESLELRDRVQWYTCMLGFLSSVASLVDRLKEAQILNYAVTELVQGNKTRRWAVGWSFGPMRPAHHVARGTKAASTKLSLLPAPTEVNVFETGISDTIGAFANALDGAIGALELLSWDWNRQTLQGTGRAADQVWRRAWRRRKKHEAQSGLVAVKADAACVVLAFRVEIQVAVNKVVVRCRWLEGFDATAFESFTGFVKASAQQAATTMRS